MSLSQLKVTAVLSREVLDSRGFPTVEAELTLTDAKGGRFRARAIAPSGASTGEGEALELRDGDDKRYLGKGTLKAAENITRAIAPAITGKTYPSQAAFDQALLALDGTPNKAKLGANAILPVSMAYARACADAQGKEAFQWIGELSKDAGLTYGGEATRLPVPLMNILNGGKHADNGLAIQEFMIVPAGFKRFSDALRAGAEIFHHLKKILHKKNLSTGVGDEGGFAPIFPEISTGGAGSHEKAIEVIMSAIAAAGYQAGQDIFLALDCAASEFWASTTQTYTFEGKSCSAKEMVDTYSQWVSKYPILSIEDGLAENDWDGWKLLTEKLGGKIQLVGDDLFVTNIDYLKKGLARKTANAILIKLNQIGTLTETLSTMALASQNRYASVTSHRSGETEDTFIAELAVGTGSGQIKTGSASRTDRIAKYNQLLRIESLLGDRAEFLGKSTFRL